MKRKMTALLLSGALCLSMCGTALAVEITKNPDGTVTVTGSDGMGTITNDKGEVEIFVPGDGTYPITGGTGDKDFTFTDQGGNSDTTQAETPDPGPDPGPRPERPEGGSGSGSNDYYISVPKVPGGTITVQPGSASRGDTVTITVTPASGYELDKLTVTDSRGNDIRLTARGENQFQFTMPAGKVSIDVSFKRVGAAGALPFTDVRAGQWFYTAVQYAYTNGLMSGVSEYSFSPDATTTRGMIVTILHNLEGKPSAGAGGFTDVGGQWYASPVAWASQNGIVSGYPDGRFGPDEAVTREQLAVILYNYAVMKGYSTSAQAGLDSFADGGSVSSWARTAVSWASAKGLINGMGDGSLAPQGRATRAQVASILMNFCENAAR